MKPLFMPIIVVALMAFFMVLKILLTKKTASADVSRYEKADALMSPAERLFFKALEEAVAGHFRLFSKVRLADIVTVKSGGDRSAWQSAFNVIQSKHVDFLAVKPDDMAIQFAVELDDKTHQRKNRQARDRRVDQILSGAEVPVFHFPAKAGYSAQEIRAKIFEEGGSGASV